MAIDLAKIEVSTAAEFVFETARDAIVSARCGGLTQAWLQRGRAVDWLIISTKGGWLAFYQIKIGGMEYVTTQCPATKVAW